MVMFLVRMKNLRSKIVFRLKSSTPAMSPLKTINATMDVSKVTLSEVKKLGEIKFAQ